MGLLTFIIKGIIIPGYSPIEDLIELGVDSAKYIANLKNESIENQLKKEGLTEIESKAVIHILTNSPERFIPNTPAAIYKYNADSLAISRQIFKAYTDGQDSYNSSKQKQLLFTEEAENDQIIKGISIIVQKALDVYLNSPEYVEYLTRRQNFTNADLRETTQKVVNQENRIRLLEGDINRNTNDLKQKINNYYNYVLNTYTEHCTGNTLLGEESLAEMYMPPCYYKSNDETGDVEQLFDKFISMGDHGVFWIVGEPGHGKTSMCIKAVADYRNKKRYQQARGVFWFCLNLQGIPEMVEPKILTLEKVFSWGRQGGRRNNMFEPSELEGSLVFLDGFDELKSSLETNDISNNQFHAQVNLLAKDYHIHIIVTSRTRALERDEGFTANQLKNGDAEITCNLSNGGVLKNKVRLLAPLTSEAQIAWINELISHRENNGVDTSDLKNYKHTFQDLQENKDLTGLLKVPILLRMIVQNCFKPSSGNRVKLYRDLFNTTLRRQGLDNNVKKLQKIYRKIAYKIFVYDNESAEISKDEFKEIDSIDAYLYQYYLYSRKEKEGSDSTDVYRVAFLHKTFYQYFLSEFLYEKLIAVNDIQSGENFLSFLWARRIDTYVLDNLRLIIKNDYSGYSWLIKAIDNTDCILPKYDCVSGSKEPIGNLDKAINTFVNVISIVSYILQKEPKEQIILSKRIIYLFSVYKCSRISLNGFSLRSADLREAKMSCADLKSADLSYADLRSADLSSADLRNANLVFTKLESVNFNLADLSFATLEYAELRNANLSLADLSDAKLNSVDLQFANLKDAELNHAKLMFGNLSDANLSSADLSDADLRSANLECADLSNADLRYADLSYTNLMSANLTGAFLKKANLIGADVENAKVTKKQYEYICKKSVKNLHKIIITDE